MDVFTVVMDSTFSIAAPYCLTLFRASLVEETAFRHQMLDISISESEDDKDWDFVDVKKRPSSMRTPSISSSPKLKTNHVNSPPRFKSSSSLTQMSHKMTASAVTPSMFLTIG